MNIRKFAAVAVLGLCAAGSAWAKDYKVGEVEIDDLWVRASAPGQSNGAGYMDIDNEAKTADRLLSISSDTADGVTLNASAARSKLPSRTTAARARRLP